MISGITARVNLHGINAGSFAQVRHRARVSDTGGLSGRHGKSLLRSAPSRWVSGPCPNRWTARKTRTPRTSGIQLAANAALAQTEVIEQPKLDPKITTACVAPVSGSISAELRIIPTLIGLKEHIHRLCKLPSFSKGAKSVGHKM
jgi:hypothetical protein